MKAILRPITTAEIPSASALLSASFLALIAPDWEPQAQAVFLSDSTPEMLERKIQVAAYQLGAFIDSQIVGFLVLTSPAILNALFVHPQFLRQGIGRGLWEAARAHIEAAFPTVKTVELNAAPGALEFYRRLGFAPISGPYLLKGARVTRMACWLPARALGAEFGSGQVTQSS
jgi:GNAT superfamily N-acetyltransferase